MGQGQRGEKEHQTSLGDVRSGGCEMKVLCCPRRGSPRQGLSETRTVPSRGELKRFIKGLFTECGQGEVNQCETVRHSGTGHSRQHCHIRLKGARVRMSLDIAES